MTPTPGPQQLLAVTCVCAILRRDGRATVRQVAADTNVSRSQVRRALELAQREQLVFSRDRNVWTSTLKAHQAFVDGTRSGSSDSSTSSEAPKAEAAAA